MVYYSRDSSRPSRNASISPTSSNSPSSSPPSTSRMSSRARFQVDQLTDASIITGRIAYLKNDDTTRALITDLTTGADPEKDITAHPIMVISRPESDPELIHFIVTTSFNGAHITQRPDILPLARYYIPHIRRGKDYIKHPLEDEDDNYRPILLETGNLFDKDCYFSLRGVYSIKWRGSILPYNGGNQHLMTELIAPGGIKRIFDVANKLHQYKPGKQHTPPQTRMSSSPPSIENRCNSTDWRNSRKDSGLTSRKLSDLSLINASNGRTKTIGSQQLSVRPQSCPNAPPWRRNSDEQSRSESSLASDDASIDQARKQKRATIATAKSWRREE